MLQTNRLLRRTLVRWLVAPALALLLFAALRASASVGLIRFEAVPQLAGFVSVQWETASETGTAAFRLYRAQQALSLGSPDWGSAIYEEAAVGDLIGAAYVYSDTNVTVGVRYWYMLEEVTTSGGSTRLAVTSGGLNLPPEDDTPTPTMTTVPASPTPTTVGAAPATATQAPGGGQPAPTATQRFTNTPLPLTPIVSTPTAVGGAAPTATLLPDAVVATPTGAAPAPTLFVPAASPIPLPTATPAPPTATATTALTTAVIAAQPSPEATKTPLVFEAIGAGEAPATAATSEPGTTGARDTGRLLLFGGGALALAAVLAAVVVFVVRARRQ